MGVGRWNKIDLRCLVLILVGEMLDEFVRIVFYLVWTYSFVAWQESPLVEVVGDFNYLGCVVG